MMPALDGGRAHLDGGDVWSPSVPLKSGGEVGGVCFGGHVRCDYHIGLLFSSCGLDVNHEEGWRCVSRVGCRPTFGFRCVRSASSRSVGVG